MQNEKCRICGKAPLSKDEIGLTKKLIDKNTADFYCISCMAEFLEASQAELLEKLEEFKEENCVYFR